MNKSIKVRIMIHVAVLAITAALGWAKDVPAQKSNEDPALKQLYAGNALYNKKLYMLAVSEFKSFVQNYPAHSRIDEAKHGIALSYYSDAKYPEAEPYLRALLENGKAGNRSQLSLFRGLCLLQMNRAADAEAVLTSVSAVASPQQVQALAVLSESQIRQEKWAKAISGTDTLLKLQSGPEYRKRALFNGGWARYQLKKYAEAVPLFQELAGLVKGEDMERQTAILLAESLRETGKYAEAAASYSIAVSRSDKTASGELQGRLGCMRFLQGSWDDAIRAFEESLKLEPQGRMAGQSMLLSGRSWLEKKDYGKASGMFNKLIAAPAPQGQKDWPHPEACLWLAKTYSRQNKQAEALKTLAEGLARFGNQASAPDMYFDQGSLLMNQEKWLDAARSMEQIQRWKDWPQRNDALRLQAVCLHKAKDFSNSLRAAEEFLKTFPADPAVGDVVFVKAENLFLCDKLDDAVKVYTEFQSAVPQHGSCTSAIYRVGQIYHRKGQWADAAKILKGLADKKPKGSEFRQLHNLLGESYFRMLDWDSAIGNLTVFVKETANRQNEPGLDSALAQLAVSSNSKADSKAAMEHFKALITRCPQSVHLPLAYAELGRLQYEAGDYAAARSTLTHFIKTYPKDTRCGQSEYYLGWICLAEKKDPEAESHFAEVTRSFRNQQFAADAYLQLGLVQLSQLKYRDAQQSLSHLAANYPQYPKLDRALFSLGLAHARAKDWGPAAEQFRKVVEKFRDSEHAPRSMYEWAWCEKGMNRPKEAVQRYAALLAAYPKSDLIANAKLEMAELSFGDKKHDDVISQLKTAQAEIKDDKLKEQTLYRLGTAYFNKGAFEECAKVMESLLKEFPNSSLKASTAFHAGEARLKIKETLLARDHFQAAVQASAGKQAEIHESSLMRLAEVQGMIKQWKESAQSYESFLVTYPKSRWAGAARFGLAFMLERQGDYQRAIAEYRKVIAAQGTDEFAARSQLQTGECLFAMKKYDEAIQELIKVDIGFRFEDWKARAVLEIARALEAKGDKEKALAQYKEVMKRFPKHEVAAVAKKSADALRHERQ
jgi:TolA-binding protein